MLRSEVLKSEIHGLVRGSRGLEHITPAEITNRGS